MKAKTLFFIFLALFPLIAQARGGREMERPFLVGPQYPFLFLSTTFEPDTAFTLKRGQVYSSLSFTNLNTYVFSASSDKANNPAGDASKFDQSDPTGYSIYFDGEIDRRYLRVYWGWSDRVELQLTYRDIRFVPGNLDQSVENFHKAFGLGNQGRDQTPRNQLDIYIHDNETGQNIFAITQPNDKFHQESMTLGLKLNLRETASEAISFVFSSNFEDRYIERELNELSLAYEKPYKKFNDYNYGLLYSSLFADWTLHAGFSMAKVGQSLFPKSPSELYYFFLGAGWQLGPESDVLLQVLEYSSPFPKDNVSTIAADVREVTTGIRWHMGKAFAVELGLTENQSQGPQNIDILFFSNLAFSF